jgi:hypothetical protein
MKREVIQTALSAIVAILLFAAPATARIRQEVGKPLQEAMRAFNAGDYKTSATWVDKASAISNLTAEELRTIGQFRDAIVTHKSCQTQPSLTICNNRK